MMTAREQAALFLRSLFLQTCWNVERMQALGLSFCLEPWLRRCWPVPAARRQAMLRHQGCFNTQPYMGSLVVGLVCALEEDAARAPAARREEKLARLAALKNAASTALAGVGDALFWGALRPFSAALALAVGAVVWVWGKPSWAPWTAAVAYLAAFDAPALALRWRGLRRGYEWGERIAVRLKQTRWQAWIRELRLAGLGAFAVALALAPAVLPPGRLAQAGAVTAASWLALAASRKLSAARVYSAVVALALLVVAAGGRLP